MMSVFGQVLGPDPAENFDEFLSCPFRAPAIWLGCGGCLMGFFIYDNEREIRVDDRILAHLQIVIIDKLRRSESFELHLRSDSVVVSMWLTRWAPLQFVYEGNRQPRINRRWVELLSAECGFTGTLELLPEPVEIFAETQASPAGIAVG